MRLPALLFSMLVLLLLGMWLFMPDVVVQSLGPADALVARPEAPVFLLGDAGGWRELPADPHVTPEEARPLPIQPSGWPSLARDGRVFALQEGALVVLSAGRRIQEVDLPRPAGGRRAAMLSGLDGEDGPVLRVRTDGGDELYVWDGAGPPWRRLELDGELASPPADRSLVLAPAGRALAYRGSDGWEAWSWGPQGVTRAVAHGCDGPDAVFLPGGEALIVDGKTDGLFRLELADGRLHWMADGNLGKCGRVPFQADFRGDPMQLLVGSRDMDGFLQIDQINVGGGGRWGFSTGFQHHYAPIVSPDGQLLVYCQATFDWEGRDEFLEDLYLFDFSRSRRADSLGSRPGGLPGRGPVFVDDGRALVFIADRDARLVDCRDL